MRTQAWLLLLLLAAAGCQRDTRVWRVAWSPDGKSCAKVAYYVRLPFPQEFFKFEVVTSSYRVSFGQTELDGYDHGIDVGLCFTELAWSADSRLVVCFALPCASPPMWFAFDAKTRRLVSPDPLKDMVREAIRQNYAAQLPSQPGLDPLAWAMTDRARDAFARKRWGPDVNLHALTTDPGHPKPIVTGQPRR